MTADLKPCPVPWCEGKAVPREYPRSKNPHLIACSRCGAATNAHKAQMDAVAQWNTRADRAPDLRAAAFDSFDGNDLMNLLNSLNVCLAEGAHELSACEIKDYYTVAAAIRAKAKGDGG